MVKKRPVSSVEEFLSVTAALSKDWGRDLWFRGEDRADYRPPLRPKLYRRPLDMLRSPRVGSFLYADQELRIEFRRRAAQLFPQVPADAKWEWYFLMEHYGVPTRLLDWTDGALVALYFAVQLRASSDRKCDAAVYVLDPAWLNTTARQRRSRRYWFDGVALADWRQVQPYLPEEMNNTALTPELPVAIDPSHRSPRVAAQRSRFVIFGRDPDGLMSAAKGEGSRLCKIRVACTATEKTRQNLKTDGISESTVFPDAEGLGRELHSLWTELCSPGG